MEYPIEILEIELHKWKEIYRQHEKYMYQDPNEFSGKTIDTATKKIFDLTEAITLLKKHL